MKNVLILIVVFTFSKLQAQDGFSIGTHLGISTVESYDLNYGLDANYVKEVSDGLKVGGALGYTVFSGNTISNTFSDLVGEVKIEDAGFLTLAGTARYSLSNAFFVGADLGYAIVTSSDGKGGILYQPKVGWQTDSIDLYGYYKGISRSGSSIGAFGVGFAYKLF